MLKIGLVGVGGISGAHIPAWDNMEDAELIALCDIRPERMKDYANKHCYTDLDQMLDQEQLDILDICLPTYLHADAAVKAMERGIHVLTEKPISLLREDVRRVYAAAERNHVCFMVAQVLRFWPEYEYVKELFDSRKYGQLLSGNMTRMSVKPKSSWDNWMMDEQRSGLVPFDLHIHDVDFMVYAFGKPQKITSFRNRRPDQDAICAVYCYDGFYINTEAAWYAGNLPFESKFRFQFEKALVVWDGSLKVYEADNHTLTMREGQGGMDAVDLPQTNAYANEIRYFADCVKAARAADKVKPEELETVIDLLNSL